MTVDMQMLEQFFAVHGSGEQYKAYSEEIGERLATQLPGTFCELVRRNGFCSYADQMLWICDPDDWTLAAKAWMPDHDAPQVFARTSFGDMFIWSKGRCWLILAQEAICSEKTDDFEGFIGFGITDREYWSGSDIERNTNRAANELGRLDGISIYSWVPSFALGGSESSSTLAIAPGVEHLIMLSGLQETKVLRF